jgi:lipooligosaccharide transport system permease protein
MTLRAYRYWILRYERTWRGSIVISVANPVLFLIAMGAGIGKPVSPNSAVLGGVDYLSFFAPGMLAAASMQNGLVESAFPVSRSKTGAARTRSRRPPRSSRPTCCTATRSTWPYGWR